MRGIGRSAVYKYHIGSRDSDYHVQKADPLAFTAEVAPKTGSVVWDLDYDWADAEWMSARHHRNAAGAPWSIYEVHVGSCQGLGPTDPCCSGDVAANAVDDDATTRWSTGTAEQPGQYLQVDVGRNEHVSRQA